MRVPISKNLNALMGASPRIGLGDDNKGIQQLLLRPALLYTPNRRFSLFGGAVWSVNYGQPVRYENRVVEQAALTRTFFKVTFTKATRLEQRFFSDINGCSVRLIEGIRASRPIGRTRFYLVAANILYLNLNDLQPGPRAGFDQNRSFFGLGYRFSRNLSVEGGYIFQHINRRSIDDTGNHIISINTNFAF